MALVNYIDILKFAREHKVTIGAFNSMNMESVQAVVSAADEMNTPLIVQSYRAHVAFAGADYMRAIAEVAARHAHVPIAMGLDHGNSFELSRVCIENGYTGVMIDLASEDYDVNVRETRRVVELAHRHNVSVEAELGTIHTADSSIETIASGYTDPEVARRFVRDTGIDCLAVSIGTAHGIYKYTPKINFELLKELVKETPCPIVVHGGSDTPDEDILRMVEMGVAKLNVGTDFFIAYNTALRDFFAEHGTHCEVVDAMAAARAAIKKVALEKLKLLTAYRV
ncbi:ketose-bisphosphate aldolase [Bacillota bacterium Meth-B3]|nr:class II fructose-bisphosphate aldolase [Christensenellaceae bacterium]MEA5068479.1 class II fructose-bisphosphate aldolase [Christensenellaceae bacterium]